MKRSLATLGLVLGASLSLTACDPPMPPEVLASLAEQTYTCEQGDSQLYATPEVAAVAADWQYSVETNCPGMTITPVEIALPSTSLQISYAGTAAQGIPFGDVPFALDAIVLAVNLPDISNVNLSADAVEQIWSGEITNWADSQIAELNPNFDLPDLPVLFGVDPAAGDTKPFIEWMTRLAGREVNLQGGKASLIEFAEGSLVLTKYSRATDAAATMVGISVDSKTEAVVPGTESILTGATMFKATVNESIISLKYDPKAKPQAPEGIAVAPLPYQALTLISLQLVGEDSLVTRAAARYLLRQDSQGSLGLSSVVALPESLRALALSTVSVGLPMPSLAPEGN